MVAGIGTRPGMSPFYATPFAGNPTVNYLKTFVDSQGIFHLLSLDLGGVVRDESPCPTVPGVPTVIGQVLSQCFIQSDSLINREWMAVSDGNYGIDVPRQWDGQFFDRVSQVGPGAAPMVSDLSAAIISISRTGGIIDVTTATPHGLSVGQLSNIAGVVNDATFNGQWPVNSVISANEFTAWGAPGQYAISIMSRVGNVVTAQFPGAPFLTPGITVIVLNSPDPTFNGIFTILTVAGTVVTWAQTAPNATIIGGQLYSQSLLVPLISILAVATDQYHAKIQLVAGQSNPFDVGSQFTIAGNSAAAFNTTWTVNAVGFETPADTPLRPFLYTAYPAGSLGAGGFGGTATPTIPNSAPVATGSAGIAGSIPAGLHQISVCFQTREQYITKPAPFGFWVAAGGFQAQVTDIALPVNVPNVTSRILIFTPVITPPATGGNWYFFDGSVVTPSAGTYPTMVIGDVTTTSYVVDFSDFALLSTPAVTNLFNLLELGECSCVCAFSNRTFWAGERNKLPNLVNTTFDGGFAGNVPLGWTLDPVNGAGGSPAASPVFGAAYKIVGDGIAARTGFISQSAYQDYLGVPVISPTVPYSVRVRLAPVGIQSQTGGIFVIQLSSVSLGGVIGASLSVTYSSLFLPTVNRLPMQEFIFPLGPIPNPPSDLVLQIGQVGIADAGVGFLADNIELFPTSQPINRTLVRGSYSSDPESFDQLTGYMIAGQDNGQAVKAMFQLLDSKLYIVKERSLYSTQDDNQNEPNLWTINNVSATVGTLSAHGVGIGESWAVIAGHDGAYIFWGGEPVKITQEIQPDWDMINWAAGSTIYVVVDTFNKRIHIGVPLGNSPFPNAEFVCDYSQLANSEGATSGEDIATHPQAYYSVYNPTKVVAPGKARKWTVWNISANSAALTIRSDGTYHLLRGNATGTGKIYDQLASQLSDDGAAIVSTYQTAFFPQVEDEQALQLGSHRKFFGYLTGYAYGSGGLAFEVSGAQNQRVKVLTTLILENPDHWDFEMNINYVAERMSLTFGTEAVGAWFTLSKLIPNIQREVITPVRGVR